ncbi:amidase [Paenarthrobacter sp. NPDC089714]|uniref:amidase n=1 Tax=Paenarthrobacter sp. NPDC089714 TaxID=3364377 RepID=UPI00381DC80D
MELVGAYLARIRAFDQPYGNEPGLTAVVAVNEAAIADAQTMDAERAGGKVRGPLHGVPILVKEVFDIQGHPITKGAYSELAADILAPDDAFTVAKLRDAGAIILARTAAGHSNVANPYDQERHPGGSSSGNGAGLAAGYAPLALGEDTGGSTRVPGSYTATVGFRPTTGLVSMDGVVPFSIWADTPGPQSLTVRDAAVMMDVIAGFDPSWPGNKEIPIPDTYTEHLLEDFLHGKTIGIFQPNVFSSDQVVIEHFDEAVKGFEKAGATLVIIDANLTADRSSYAPGTELLWESASDWNVAGMVFGTSDYSDGAQAEDLWLSKLGADNSKLAKTAEPFDRLTRVDRLTANGEDTSDPGNEAGRQKHELQRSQLRGWFASHVAKSGADFVVYPSTRTLPPKGKSIMRSGNTMIAPLLGYPALSVPAGYVNGLPTGMEIMGTSPGTDAEVLGAGYAYEQATKCRMAPASTPSLAGEAELTE